MVVAARREEPLQEIARECERLGVRALAVPTDVTDEPAVQELARRAEASFGRVDVWVNNAAVSLFARFEDAPPEVFRRVVETNFFGYVHGARAALPLFRRHGSGVLVNNASLMGRIGGPYVSAYVASKWAIRGFAECLRQELRDADDIHVCTILPASIDTPFFQHAANYTGRAAKPLSPVNRAEDVAEAIVELAEDPRREILVGRAARTLSLQHTLAPALTERIFAAQVERDHFQDTPAPASAGNVFEPTPEWTSVSGGWRQDGRKRGRLIGAGVAAAVPAVAAAFWLRR